MNEPPSILVTFHELGPDQFPFTMALFDVETGEEVWRKTVGEPAVIRIPGFAPRKVLAWIAFPDGIAIEGPSGDAWYLPAR